MSMLYRMAAISILCLVAACFGDEGTSPTGNRNNQGEDISSANENIPPEGTKPPLSEGAKPPPPDGSLPTNLVKGIVPDGLSDNPTDNAPLIQQALDKAAAENLPVVQLPEGVFGIRRALGLPSNVELRGAGKDKTTVILTHLETPLTPIMPPQCIERKSSPQLRPAAAVFNKNNRWFLSFVPINKSGGCDSPTAPQPVVWDENVGMGGLTIDCNVDKLWPGILKATHGNSGCAYFENLDGLSMNDVRITNGAVDGLLLGWVEGVINLHIEDSEFTRNQRFGIGWVLASLGKVLSSKIADNIAGGVDFEPCCGAGQRVDLPHDILFEQVSILGRKSWLDQSPDSGYGITLALARLSDERKDTIRGITHGIHFKKMLIKDMPGFGVFLLWKGKYQDISFEGTMENIGYAGLMSSASGEGSFSIAGQMTNIGWANQGGAVEFSGEACDKTKMVCGGSGSVIGPLYVRTSPVWHAGSMVVLQEFHRNITIQNLIAKLACDPRTQGGCVNPSFVYQYGYGRTPHPSILIQDSGFVK